ncbi:PREDICTED: protein Skeletor, isoforms B/C-like isoform X1 [Nicrophorus vespilloides]|uniref:Protein Skeletor, isoforms B/C-like isoform X1 n=1 Tax=Nicrophorus vespilloides TaxID=110193 RepID=A0ABM1NI71_NICVS|nr:PREDICTED: protein Skeletor, isoforms B/C-like isoform X1 [Nicrophorus vespilloides]
MAVSITNGRNLLLIVLLGLAGNANSAEYLGKFLGKLTELHHGVSGEVYAVDSRTLHIKDFTYDGQGPAAYFFAGNSRSPGNTGFRIRDENGSPEVLRRYRKEGVTITLPDGKTLNTIKWFSVWCEEFEVNFGDVKIPRNFDYPRPQKIDALRGVHAVNSDNIVIVDAQTLLVPNLSYDGEAPDAKFWVGSGSKPSPQGIRVPDENGKIMPLRKYDRKTVVLTLPGDLTVFDIGHFGIWCEAFTVDFGHVQVPQSLNIPPSLKMLGVSPQSKLNCEVLHDDFAFEVRWAVAGDSIVLQLVSKLENREYMSFGVSGEDERSAMVGGDVVVAWVDKETLKGYAEDYHLDAKSQCSGKKGSCPDTRISDNTNNIRLLNAAMVNGYSIVTYQRPLRPSDQYDKQIFTNQSQPVIWALGPLNQRNEVSFHSQFNKKDKFIDFGRAAKWNCPMPEGDQPPMKPVTAKTPVQQPVQQTYVAEEEEHEEEVIVQEPPKRTRNNERRRGPNRSTTEVKDSEKSASRTKNTERRRPVPTPKPVSNRNAWDIPAIQCHEPDDGVFYAQMGPTGGKRGYPAITGHVGWGISWYINGLLIPEINVVRGKTYTFVVEGGFDPETPAKYHPFYITDDSVGGYEHKTDEEKKSVKIFAGVRKAKDGSAQPTGVGRLCHWTHQGDSDADDFESFGAYQRTLELKCDQGEPGVIQWTPDKDTPDTVYYQCFTHRYLGWKINVLDDCDAEGAASEIVEDLADAPSIRVETRVKPNGIEEVINKEEETTTKISFSYMDLEATKPAFIQELPKMEMDKVFNPEEELKKPIKVRRPVPMNIRPPFVAKPQRPMLQRMPPKKPYYRPAKRPIVMNHRPMVMLKQPMVHVPKPMDIEISPKQASTEKEPNGQTEKSTIMQQNVQYEVMRPAINTGFNPASVVIESGFKPIITKEIEHRMVEEEGPELEFESEVGIIDETATNNTNENQKPTVFFEPMFIPSPTIDVKKSKKKSPLFSAKQPRNVRDESIETSANERVESYYLPPANQRMKPKVVEEAPSTVVTYDGKKLSGSSLTVRAGDQRSVLGGRSSKATEYLKARPQFLPFKGELPPLNHRVDPNAPQLQTRVLNRQLDTPVQPVTKLKLIRNLEEDEDKIEDSLRTRTRRSAHHTEEHTMEMMAKTSASATLTPSTKALSITILAALLLKL